MAKPLSEYERKRDFGKTTEPRGSKRQGSKAKASAKRRHPRFTIQKHSATSLHYDLRLEIGGTLASWAVPKGPSLDPRDKRLAMRTEDHPLDYLTFEGVIPKGSYGGGPMIVWDRGVFENISKTRRRRATRARGGTGEGRPEALPARREGEGALRPGPHLEAGRPRAVAADQEEGRGSGREAQADVEPARIRAERKDDRGAAGGGGVTNVNTRR